MRGPSRLRGPVPSRGRQVLETPTYGLPDVAAVPVQLDNVPKHRIVSFQHAIDIHLAVTDGGLVVCLCVDRPVFDVEVVGPLAERAHKVGRIDPTNLHPVGVNLDRHVRIEAV